MGRYVRWLMVFCLSAVVASVGWAAPQTGKGQPQPSAQEKGGAERGWLGVEVRNLTTEEIASGAATSATQGVKVVRIIEGSPAEEMLTGGDLLISIDGKEIDSARGMFATISGRAPGREIKLGVNHGGKKRVVTLKLGVRPPERTAAKSDATVVQTSANQVASGSEAARIGAPAETLQANSEASTSAVKAEAKSETDARQTPPAPGESASVPTGEALPPADPAGNRPVETSGAQSAPASAASEASPPVSEPAVPVVTMHVTASEAEVPPASLPRPDSLQQGGASAAIDDKADVKVTGDAMRLAARDPQSGLDTPAAPLPAGVCDGLLVVTAETGGGRAPRCVKPGAGRSPEHVFRDCPACPVMVIVPAGAFMMGSPKDEGGDKNSGTLEHNKAEDPQHPVTIPAPFAAGKYSVTFEEWDACVADGGCGDYTPKDQGWGRGRRPVINVSWADARAYVKWLNRKTSQDYRLLSEAEREYVTRAGTASPYWWGVVATTEQANFSYDINAGGTYKFDGQTDGKFRNQTLPVDDLQPNPWGLHHVHGNVSEWVEDCLHENYKNKPEELKKTGSAWKVGDCFYHVKRGGGYNVTRTYVRSAARLHDEFDSRQSNTSFRVARSVAP